MIKIHRELVTTEDCYMRNYSDQLININMIYDNLGNEISVFLPQLHTTDPFSFTLIKMMGLNIIQAEEVVRKAKMFF